MKKQVKRVLLGIAILAIASVAVYLKMAPSEIPLTFVAPKTAELVFTEQGELTAGQVIRISPLVQGEVTVVYVEEGQHIKQGDLICTIDPEPVQEKIKQTKSTITSYQSQMESQNGTIAEQFKLRQIMIEQGERDVAQARRDLERNQMLYQGGFVSQSDLEAARLSVDRYQAELDSNRQELKILSESTLDSSTRSYYQALIEIEESNLTLLEKELEQSTVKAPADGIITAVPVREANITGTEPVAELAVTDQIYVETYVSTNDIGSITLADPVRLSLTRRGGDVEFTGKVARIGNTASLMVSTLGLEERKVKVEIIPDFTGLDEELGIGYEMEVGFALYRQADQLTVPKTALFKQDGTDMIWVVRKGVLRAVPVTTGMELRTETVILKGLEPECYVVTDANDKSLRDGLRVVVE